MPPVVAVALLYQVLSQLQVAVLHTATLLVIGAVLVLALGLGLAARFGGTVVRVAVLALVAVCWLDVAFGLGAMFEPLTPAARAAAARDRTRLDDISAIRDALERHIREIGPLPRPAAYGEQTGPPEFWNGWWDTSTHDGNGNGRPFLDFLVDRGLMAEVPLDPANQASPDRNPTRGQQYAFFVAPAGYVYEGGHCGGTTQAVYMLGVTDLEGEQTRPTGLAGSGCECLWLGKRGFFDEHFDYLVCGAFRP